MDSPTFFLGADFNFDAVYSTLAVSDEALTSADSQQPEQGHQLIRRSRPRASLACIPCRTRHLKCDAKQVCSRCKADDRNCVYAKSRRGGKRRRSTFAVAAGDNLDGSFLPADDVISERARQNTSLRPLNSDDSETAQAIDEGLPHASPPRIISSKTDVQFLDLYYENFHDSHPIALPQWSLEARLQTDSTSLDQLIPVLEFIGSIYQPDGQYHVLRQAAYNSLTESNALPYNGFSVQALLLFAIALHCSDEYEAGDIILDRAVDIALSIQMNRQGFARANGEGNLILEESWRRTYWTLVLIDGLFAAINHRKTHRLQKVFADVDLPCEDLEYEMERIPEPRTFREYDNRELEADDIVFSSFTYLIDAGRILSAILGINQGVKGPSDRKLLTADAKIVTWFLHLPKCKQIVLGEGHEVDELMFLAHLWMNTEKLLLHRPHSQLLHSNVEAGSKCTPIYPETSSNALERCVRLHTAKSLEAIEAAMKLLVLPSPHLKHSPIVTCSLALAIMAQVSACNHVLEESTSSYMAGRERVRLGLGVLKTHERYWGLARRSIREVKSVARQLLSTSSPVDNMETQNCNATSVWTKEAHSDASGDGQDVTDLLEEHFSDFQYGTRDNFHS